MIAGLCLGDIETRIDTFKASCEDGLAVSESAEPDPMVPAAMGEMSAPIETVQDPNEPSEIAQLFTEFVAIIKEVETQGDNPRLTAFVTEYLFKYIQLAFERTKK